MKANVTMIMKITGLNTMRPNKKASKIEQFMCAKYNNVEETLASVSNV